MAFTCATQNAYCRRHATAPRIHTTVSYFKRPRSFHGTKDRNAPRGGEGSLNVCAKAAYVGAAPMQQQSRGLALAPPAWATAAVNITALAAAGAAALCMLHTPDGWLSPGDAYTAAVVADPLGTKAVISGTVYLLGDLIAQSFGEGRSVADWDRARALRSGLVGLLAHGPLSHCYYLALDSACSTGPLAGINGYTAMLLKIGIDQTVWSMAWNATYCALLGLLKLETPADVVADVRATAWPLLKAGWRLWPLVHIVTYGLVPVQHRLLFVDSVELVWVAIMSLACSAGSADRVQATAPVPDAVAEPATTESSGSKADVAAGMA